MAMHLVRRNARSVPWVTEETLAPVRRQDSTDRDVGPRTSKSPYPSESPDNRILRGYCRAKGSRDLVPFHIRPMAHDEEEEMFEEEQRESRPPGCKAEDNRILSRP